MSASARTAGARPADPTEATEGCRYCWMCRHVCPVGHVTQRETLTPHGWGLTIASVKRGTLRWNAETADVLYACADCGLCRTHCVTDQPLPEAIAAARADVAASGLAPRAVYLLHEKLQAWGNPYGAIDRRAPQAQGGVGLFVSDAVSHAGGRTLDAALTLLAAAGVRPVPVAAGRSNGAIASSLGFPETASALARAILADVAAAGCQELLVLGPGDRYAFERLYRDRLQIDWPAGVTVTEVTTVLAGALHGGRLAFRQREDAPAYAYHDPCHGPRIGRDGAAPRALLRAALGPAEVHLFWRGQRAHPCGAIGGLEITQPALAARLAEARFADAVAAGARWLVADDPACLHHLMHRRPDDVEVRGLYDLLVERLAR